MADEQSFIELIIANERVHKWIDAVNTGKRRAVLELRAAVESSPAYAEEASRAGAVAAVTRVLAAAAKQGDEELLDAATSIIAACSGPMSCAGRLHKFQYGDLHVTIQEGMLGDGLGAKVWGVAHVLADELVEYPQLVQGQRVLEIGAGCGLNGIVAAKLGAAEVVLTDVEGPVLLNLAQCVVLNSAVGGEEQSQSVPGDIGSARSGGALYDDRELFDEAEEVDDFDLGELLGANTSRDGEGDQQPGCTGTATTEGAGSTGMGGGRSSPVRWEAGNMKVRLLDWEQSLRHLDASESGGDSGQAQQQQQQQQPGTAPQVPLDDTFEVVLGNEVMYEPLHAELVAAVVAHKLAPHGACLVCCAVRDLATFKRFRSECARRGLRCRQRQLQPPASELHGGQPGIVARHHDYEGGFLMMAVDHVRAPHTKWHRDDFE